MLAVTWLDAPESGNQAELFSNSGVASMDWIDGSDGKGELIW